MRYVVWTVSSKPENGTAIEAKSSFEARQICAKAWGKSLSEVIAQRPEILARRG